MTSNAPKIDYLPALAVLRAAQEGDGDRAAAILATQRHPSDLLVGVANLACRLGVRAYGSEPAFLDWLDRTMTELQTQGDDHGDGDEDEAG